MDNSKYKIQGSLKVACVFLLVLLAISTSFVVYLFMQNTRIKNEIDTLRSQVSSLQTERDNLNSVIKDLESQRANLWNENENLKNKVDNLENKVQLLEENKNALEAQVSSLQAENEYLRSQVEPLMEIVNMKKSDVLINETLIFLPDAHKTWDPFFVKYCGILLVRVQMIPEPGFADIPSVQIGVDLSSKLYITRSGTLNLTPTPYYYTSTALFPIADLEFPIRFGVTVRNKSPYTVKLMVTITYVY